MQSATATEAKDSELATYSTAWIGEPPTAKRGVPGHDVFAVFLLAEALVNPIVFWCLDKCYLHYQKVFKGNKNIEVKSIEKYLVIASKDIHIRPHAKKLQQMMDVLLHPSRNKTIDRMVIKDALFVFLLYCFSGYMGDSNIRPEAGIKITLPTFDKMHVPILSEPFPVLDKSDIESWLLYSPKPFTEIAKKLFEKYCVLFLKREKKIYAHEGYSKSYHDHGVFPFHLPICQYVKLNLVELWVGKVSSSNAYVILPTLHLIKNYYNSHKFSYSGFFDKNPLGLKEAKNDSLYDQLFLAIADHDAVKLEFLIKHKMDINRQIITDEVKGETPLHHAVIYKNLFAIKLLLKYQANHKLKAQYTNLKPMTPYELADKLKLIKIIKLFDDHFTKTASSIKKTSLFFDLTENKPAQCVKELYHLISIHKKDHPQDEAYLNILKKQLRKEYYAINYNSPHYTKQASDFLIKYQKPSVIDLLKMMQYNSAPSATKK